MPLPSPRRAALAAATLTLIAAPLTTATPAHAQYPPTIPLEINDTDGIIEAGDEITFIARGYDPGEGAIAQLIPTTTHHRAAQPPNPAPTTNQPRTTTLGHFTANSQGTVIGCATLPSNTTPGDYLFKVIGNESGRTLTTPLTIEENQPGDTANTAPGGPPNTNNTNNTNHQNNSSNQGSTNHSNNQSGGQSGGQNAHNGHNTQGAGQNTQNSQNTQNGQSSQGGQQSHQATGHNQQAHHPHQRAATTTDQLAHTGSTTTWALTGTAAALAATGSAALIITRRRHTHTRQH